MGRMTLSPRPMAVTGRSADRCPQSKKLPFKQPIWRYGAEPSTTGGVRVAAAPARASERARRLEVRRY
jgi:hypothetical protein